MESTSVHVPVMPREVLHHLQLAEGLSVMDGTVGAGGHSSEIIKHIGASGQLYGFDRDPMMLNCAGQKLSHSNVHLIHASYVEAQEQLGNHQVSQVDRILLDLGLSSDQLADRERGFGFDAGGPLDMRFDTSQDQSAAELLNEKSQDDIEALLTEYGEEPFARQIAERICVQRRKHPFNTTDDLEQCVRAAVPRSAGSRTTRNPATRVFQALRIAVNHELEHVQRMMTSVLPAVLAPDGIAAIITFHSLEDRIVKSAFKGKQEWQVLTKTPVESTPAEVRLNPRSRSAKMRVARRKRKA